MKFIITEAQLTSLKEIGRVSGHYEIQPVYNLIEYFDENLSDEKKYESFKKYFRKKIGSEIRFLKGDAINFFDSPYGDYWPEEYTTKDSLSGFVYYISKKYFELKEGVDIEFMVVKEGKDKEYYFFDPFLKILVGRITIQEKEDLLPGKNFKVGVSSADEELRGKGYGTRMYLTIIDRLDYLFSDSTLFSGAYRMWKHVLPKYVNVWGVIEKGIDVEFEKIEPEKKKSISKYDYFVASSSHNKV